MITKLVLRNFKRISEETFEFTDFAGWPRACPGFPEVLLLRYATLRLRSVRMMGQD